MSHVSTVRQSPEDFEDPDVGKPDEGFADSVDETHHTEPDDERPNYPRDSGVYRHPERGFGKVVPVENYAYEALGNADKVE